MGIETINQKKSELITSEYAKRWTEKSPYSKLKDISNILNNTKIQKVNEFKELKNKIDNREYRIFQKIVGVPYNRCDGKLGKESLDYFSNYIEKFKEKNNIFTSIRNGLSELGSSITEYVGDMLGNNSGWNMNENTNHADTLNIQHNEAQYLANHETMSLSEYNRLFSGKEKLQQGQIGDCYLVSGINELARAQHFDTLMRTSITRVRRNNGVKGYEIKIPFGEPSGRKIYLADFEISVAKIRGNIGYKLLELAYAKNKLRRNNRIGNRYYPITPSELEKIKGGWTHEVLQTFLGKNNIGFCDFGTMRNYKKGKTLAQSSQNAKNEIHNFLKNYVPSIGNKFVSLASLPGSSDKKSYTVGGKTIYRRHAYSLTGVKKDNKGDIKSITVLNPWNIGGPGNNYQDFTLDEFYKSFSAMSCGKIKTETFLDNKGII